VFFREVVGDLVKKGEVDITSKYPSLNKHKIIGDFRFVVLEKILSKSNVLTFLERFTMDYYFILKRFSLSEERGFGLDISFVTIERVPLMVSSHDENAITRVT
jgi:KUP system potassium uptake protein